MNHVIMANQMISLVTSSTTDPRLTPTLVVFQIYRGMNKIEIHKIKINTYIPFCETVLKYTRRTERSKKSISHQQLGRSID
jgi:hypothetical protein